MASGIEVRRIGDEREAAAYAEILTWAFAVDPAEAPRWIEHAGWEHTRIVVAEGKVAGGLFLLPVGQWYGGRRVSMTGVAAVAVAPEYRGRGVGGKLLRDVVRELQANQVALSTLYPAALGLYRSVGYEPAGSRFKITMRPTDIGLKSRDLPLSPIRPEDEAAIEGAYRLFASTTPGYLDRNSNLWSRIRHPGARPATGWVVNGREGVEGYLYAVEGPPDERSRYPIVVSDLVALSHRAGKKLLATLADHRSVATEVSWFGGASSVLLALLPEQAYQVSLVDHFATRVVDVQLALSTRGYPLVDAELAIEVVDPLLKQNNDRFMLEVSDGEGAVRRAGPGSLRVDVRALAALFTGFLSPYALLRAGLVHGAQRSLETAEFLFAGAAPCMSDSF